MVNELVYGAKIHLQNGYAGWSGGYLDTNGHSTDSGAKYAVSTADTATRGAGTGTWEILSASGKANGSPVVSGDVVHLRNLYGGDGGYLDTNGHANASQKSAGGKYNVSTSTAKDRAAGTGRWRLYAQTSGSPADQTVRAGGVIHLWNLYGDNGGFLETNGHATDGGKLDVCTNAYYNRSQDVADWKIHNA
ncbi:hypothetical protein FHS29_007244 [Saccharothrix tamanrassetensis]|uniref:Ricin B lectin domain-containing protein n=1 Tax=Saccharothrix tamanrassetensis TaxID=1051531 RepID=A0A841CZ77_9PSEU|nr:hypothetical protein [Saccharothrix tamanrassetensis]MBB5960616.1 hypothetical protein [Saccharothrix tamanrassetensis]